MSKNVLNTYTKLDVDVLRRFNVVPVDVYIQLSGTRALKVIHKDEPYSKDLLDHYSAKGITHFLVLKNEYTKFASDACKSIALELEDTKDKSFCAKTDVQQVAVQLIMGELMSNDALHPETSKLLYQTLHSAVDEIKKCPSLGNILKCFMRRKDFLSGHSLQMAYIGGIIVHKMRLQSSDSISKIAIASLLHDICMDDIKLSKVLTTEELQSLSKSKQSNVMNHPFQSAEYLTKLDNLPVDLESIIVSHHETPSNGFPGKVKPSSISQLAAVLVICEDFVTRVYGNESDKNFLVNIRAEFAAKYNVGNFVGPLNGFMKLCEDLYVFSDINCSC